MELIYLDQQKKIVKSDESYTLLLCSDINFHFYSFLYRSRKSGFYSRETLLVMEFAIHFYVQIAKKTFFMNLEKN